MLQIDYILFKKILHMAELKRDMAFPTWERMPRVVFLLSQFGKGFVLLFFTFPNLGKGYFRF